MYHVELRGLEIESHKNSDVPYVSQSSVEIITAIAERATGRISIRQPPRSSFAAPVLLADQDGHLLVDEASRLLVTRPASGPPKDFDEITIDYPHRPYRAEAIRSGALVAYWPLDDAAVTTALDLKGLAPLDVRAGNDTHFRAYRQETSAVPYGAAIEFTHTGGASGLSGVLPTVGSTFTIAGFFRMQAAAVGERTIFRVGTSTLSVSSGGAITISMDGVAPSAAGVIPGVWHHVAVVRTPTVLELWINGVLADAESISISTAPLDGATIQFARASGGNPVDLALDEWGVWDQAINVADLVSRRHHVRKFGGYIYGLTDATEYGPTDTHTFRCNLAGYGLRLDGEFVRHTYASASGSTVRQIVHDVLVRAGLQHEFTSHGVEIDDTVLREVYPVLSVMEILRSLANAHGAIVTADEWKEIDMVRRLNVEHSSLVLRGGRGGNVKAIGRSTEPRFYGNSAIVVGRGERGTVEETHTTDGVTRRYDAGQPIGEILSITLDGVDETFDGPGARWTVDTDQQRFELANGEIQSGAGKSLKFTFVSDESMVVTADDPAAIAEIGFRLAKRYEDDTIDTVSLARTLSAARLDRHNQLFEEFIAISLPGEITALRPGVAPVWEFQRHELGGVRLLVEKVSERTVKGGGGFHPVELTISGTALDYQGGVGDVYRAGLAYRPPAPRPGTGVAADPNQVIIRPTDVAISVSLPIRLGGSLSAPTSTAAWTVPDGAILTRVSGHQIGVPLSLSFMARCLPRGVLGPGQGVEVRLWDATSGVAIGSAVFVNTTDQGGSRGVLRGIGLPLREFDLIYQVRALAGLRAGIVWGVALHLDL